MQFFCVLTVSYTLDFFLLQQILDQCASDETQNFKTLIFCTFKNGNHACHTYS